MKTTNTSTPDAVRHVSLAFRLIHRNIKFLITGVCLLLLEHQIFATPETLSAGSFIIDMGQTPQNFGNGLKPYGLVYDLIKNHRIPIKWIINPTKLRDGVDFSHNNRSYSGGPFIVPAEFRTAAVNARISYWQTQGVQGATTITLITVEVFTTLKVTPVWSLGEQNGNIAAGYLINAGIPSTAYNFYEPNELTCCQDLFVMPHTDPKWPNHGNLFTWNLDCKGAIWLSCHAGSGTEDLFNPANKSQQLNFLTNKTGVATGNGPYEENALILWGNHNDGTSPYNYAYPTDPIMQFLGSLDPAMNNGSEQIYLPKLSWRPGAKIYVWDPTHADVPSKSPGPAVVIASGRAYDDPNRGRVMMEGGHSHNKGNSPNHVAAQRAFLNFSFWSMNEKASNPDLSGVPDTLYSGTQNPITFTLPPGFNPNSFTVVWSSTCGGAFSPNNQAVTTYTPPSAVFPTSCVISVMITDACGRVFSDSKAITIGCNASVTTTTTNPSCFGSNNGSILMTITQGDPPYAWNWTRVSPAANASGTTALINNLIAGVYNVTVTSSGMCPVSFTSNLTQPLPFTASNTSNNAICYGSATGSINVTLNGGTPPYTFNWGGGITTQNRSNIPAGNYAVTVTDANGCTSTTAATITQPALMVITPTVTHVACYGASTGAINITVSGGTGSKTYNWSNGASTQNISNLPSGNYTVTVTDANACMVSLAVAVNQSTQIVLSATQVNTSCTNGNNGSINLSVSGGNSPYSYLWSNGATSQDINNLSIGLYIVTVTDALNCTATLSRQITEPLILSLSIDVNDATCPDDADGSVDLNVSGGVSPYTYDWDIDGYEGIDNDSQDLSAMLPGYYTVIVTDANGCNATVSATVDAKNPFPPPPSVITH